jgi:hypothetical protein
MIVVFSRNIAPRLAVGMANMDDPGHVGFDASVEKIGI